MNDHKASFVILLGRISFITPYLFEDVANMNNVVVQQGNLAISSRVTRVLYYSFLRKVNRINRYFDKHILSAKRYSFLENYPFKETEQYYVILSDYGTEMVDFRRLSSLKRDNIKFVLLFFNPLNREKTKYPFANAAFFDLVITIDPDDAQKNNFCYYPQIYSRRPSIPKNDNKALCAYFIGYDKGRGALLSGIAETMKSFGIVCSFKVMKGKASDTYPNLTYLPSILPYDKVLEDIQKSDIIIDLFQPGQTGVSIRYAEAVCYNKILITNNKTIADLPYYDPKYMHIIEKPEDIEPVWFDDVGAIDYNYKDDFSPRKLLEFIEEKLPFE